MLHEKHGLVYSHPVNRLVDETSPYLRQHADNPVDWYPWCAQALERARRENRPILLSIGYSACHWCHVMAHESFADPATAELMNALFVNIKVDREERPDLDRIYQAAHQLLTRRGGGWPLTVFLDPHDLTAFFAGTYFPPEPRYGLPGFPELLQRVAAFYREHHDEIASQNRRLQDALASLNPADRHEGTFTALPLDLARQQLGRAFDARHGGFGGAPKFPQPTRLERLLRHWTGTDDRQALHMACFTLERMAGGGIHDHLGGGFFRYAVDQRWEIPHFEKMLYDNAQLLALYAQAWAATGQALFATVAEETAAWALREMLAPQGGFYSALDADSEGGEGAYYIWEREAVQALLSEPEYRAFAPAFGLDGPPNFEGRWHLRRTAGETGDEAGRDLLKGACARLLKARAKRTPPARDEKILTAWNALMIRGLAMAARLLAPRAREDTKHATWEAAATRALDFIRAELWRDGRLRACWTAGRTGPPAYLDDHAFLLDALLEHLQLRWRPEDLGFASDLAEALLSHFMDTEKGGFYFTAHDHEPLIHRPKPYGDEALPSGNGVAARALLRLGHLLGETRYLQAAEACLRNAWSAVQELPYGHGALLDALDELLTPPTLIVLRGQPDMLRHWQRAALQAYDPRRLVFAIPDTVTGLPAALGARAPVGERKAVAYLCRGTHCEPPITRLEDFQVALQETASP